VGPRGTLDTGGGKSFNCYRESNHCFSAVQPWT
jgi:hypothetical protein